MRPVIRLLPTALVLLAGAALLAHGPIAQLANYHAFADQRPWLGLPNGADVLSNLGFGLVALWGMARLWPARGEAGPGAGYVLFLAGLLLTAFGSSFYHLAPDNLRLAFDRLPIALVCAGLLAGVRADLRGHATLVRDTVVLALCAGFSVGWWAWTEAAGAGDLRPYLLLQGAPLVLVPLWQAIHGAPRADRLAFGAALLLYIAAKVAELNDQSLLTMTGALSGHTLKHLLATAAAGLLVARLAARRRDFRLTAPAAPTTLAAQ